MKSSYIREGFHTITPYLLVPGIAHLLDFLKEAFEAKEETRLIRTDGSIMHAEVSIGDSMLMLGEPNTDFDPFPGNLYLYVQDCDATYKHALKAGGRSIMEPTTMIHAGQRYGGIKDPSDNCWWIATHLEDLSEEEEQRRIKELGL